MDDNELEYEDIEDEYHEDDDDEYADEEEDSLSQRLGSSRSPGSPFKGSSSSPFSSRSSGSPFSSRSSNPFSSRFSAAGDDDDDEDDEGKSSFRNRGGTTSNPRATGQFRRTGGGPIGGRRATDEDDDEANEDDKASGGSPFRTRSGTNPFSSKSSSGGSPFGSRSAGGSSGDKNDPRRSTGQVRRTPGGGDSGKEDSSKGSSFRTRGGSGSFGSRGAGGSSGDKSDPRRSTGQVRRTSGSSGGGSSSGSGLPGRSTSSRFSSGGGSSFQRRGSGEKKEDDASKPKNNKDDAAKDDDGGQSPGERLKSLRSRFSLGSGGKDKDTDNKAKDDDSGGLFSGASGTLSGIGSKLPFGGGGSDDDTKKPDAKKTTRKPESKKDDDSGGGLFSGASSALSGIGSKLPFGGKATSDDAEVKPTAGQKSSSPRFGSRGSGGKSPSSSKKSSKKADEKDNSDSKSFGDRVASLTSNLPFTGGGDEKKPASKTVRQRSKTPKVETGEGLSLDRKLDILGVGLVIVSLALLLSSFSPNQGVITESINTFFESLLGWGAWAVPVVMMLAGGWLIVRHFGDDPPTLDIERLIGAGIIYVSALVLFQFIHALNYTNVTSFEELANLTQLSWTQEMFIPSGGGWVGGNLYLLMVQYLGEILAFSVTLFGLIVGVMLLVDVSVSEIAIITIGLWRSFRAAQRRASERKKVRRAERLAKRQEQVAALTPSEPDIEVTKPQAEQLTSGESDAEKALPAPGSEREIPITMGGKTVNTSLKGEAKRGENQQSQQNDSGLLGGVLTSVLPFSSGDTPAETTDDKQKESNQNSDRSPFGSLMNRLPFGDSGEPEPQPKAQPPQQSQPPPGNAQSAAPPPTLPQDKTEVQQPSQPLPSPPSSAPNVGADGNDEASPDENKVLESKRISQVVEAVDDDEKSPDSEQKTGSDERLNRLNEIRQGHGGHPKQNQNGSPQQADTPEEDKESPKSPAVNGGKSAFIAGKTDAYGNPPTPPPSMTRPDEAKPEPVKAQVMNNGFQRPSKRDWTLPDIHDLLSEGSEQDFDRQFLVEQARVIEDTLKSFGAPGRVVEINTGPVITQYGVEPDYLQSRSGKRSRVKVSAIAQLDRDLQLALGARSIRIEAPVPGKGYVGIEIPNAENALVSLKDVMESDQFKKIEAKSSLAIALGQSVDGTPVAADLGSMPHMLIAGTTGSGKSVCINSIISSLLANNTPEQLKLIMVDPKRVELTGYNGIPHLIAPVVVELERIVGVLKWVTREMDERYKRFSNAGARHIEDFNKHLPPDDEPMPYIVVIIDELADLMMLAPEETERTITRIAALARATGIHLVIATQRPSVDVVTGLIKANFPARVAFAVAGSVDSRVILDQPGAERLLGRGDMLYLSGESPAPQRLQGVFVSDDEIDNITRYWRAQSTGVKPAPVKGMAPLSLDPSSAPRQVSPASMPGASSQGDANQPSLPMQQAFWDSSGADSSGANGDEPDDELYEEAVEMVKRLNKASVSLLQRRLRIGYTRASRLIDMMEERGVVGPQESGSKPREVLAE